MSSDEEYFHQSREKFKVERSSEPQPGEVNTDFFGPALPPHLLEKQTSESGQRRKVYGPLLADHLQGKKTVEDIRSCISEEAKGKSVIGPEMPEYLKSHSEPVGKPELSGELDEGLGPSTDLMATDVVANYYRSINSESSMKKGASGPSVEREEWMTQLPAKKGAGFGLFARQFKTRMQTEKESDSSVWTEMPADKDKKDKKKDHKVILEMNRLKERDQEMEKLAKKAEKKLRKKESLLDIHFKIKGKKKKKEAKDKKDVAPERRPFDRNIDLQIHKFDERKRKAILNKSQFLNDRFAPGQSKFL